MNRYEVFARDGYRCVYCGHEFTVDLLSVDHVHPRVKGGDDSSGNVVTACTTCNAKKGARTLARFLADEADVRANFDALAVHVWPRHRTALAEAIARALASS